MISFFARSGQCSLHRKLSALRSAKRPKGQPSRRSGKGCDRLHSSTRSDSFEANAIVVVVMRLTNVGQSSSRSRREAAGSARLDPLRDQLLHPPKESVPDTKLLEMR